MVQEIRKVFLTIVCLCASAFAAKAQVCSNAYYADANINGTLQNIYIHDVVNSLPVVSGVGVPVSLAFRTILGQTLVNPTGISLYYTVDDAPVGPLLSFSPYTSTIDTTQLNDGTHVLSVKYAKQPTWPDSCQYYSRLEFEFVVANNGIVTGTQSVTMESRPSNRIPQTSRIPSPSLDRTVYPGFQPYLPNNNPYPYTVAPSANRVFPVSFWVEPLNHNGSDFSEGTPSFYQLSNGSVVTSMFYPELGGTIESVYDAVEHNDFWDGPRNSNNVDPYSNCVSNLDRVGFYCVGLEGRLYSVSMDGSIATIAGLVSTGGLSFYNRDTSLTIPTSTQKIVGSMDSRFIGPNDLVIDPRNHNIIYVADTMNNRVAKVDISMSPAVVTTYAGLASEGHPGYVDGPALSSRFNKPYSITMSNDGTMYVSDNGNSVIRKITPDGSTVSTIVGKGPTGEPSAKTVASSPLTYAPLNSVPFSSAYINYPFAVRLDSTGRKIVEVEPSTMTVRVLNLSDFTVSTIARINTVGDSSMSWLWVDVDTNGTIGPVDEVLLTRSQFKGGGSVSKFPITGTNSIPPADFYVGKCPSQTATNIHFGPAPCVHRIFGHYPWTVAISKTEGRAIFMGYGSSGIFSFHITQPSDPSWVYSNINFANGFFEWTSGTVAAFPFGSRPSFDVVHGYEGFSRTRAVLNSDDMAKLPDSSFCVAVMPAGTLGAYLQSGAEGNVPRPELTGNDLRDLSYFVRRNSLSGGATGMAVPGPSCTDIAPVISGMFSSSIGGNAIVLWTTNQPTLGMVQYGTSPGQFFAWSSIENTYGAAHSVQLSNLYVGSTVYYQIISKNVAGNTVNSAGSFVVQ